MSLSVSFCTNSVALPLAYQVNGGNKFIIVFWCLYLSLHPYIQAITKIPLHIKKNTGVTFWGFHQDKLNNFDCLNGLDDWTMTDSYLSKFISFKRQFWPRVGGSLSHWPLWVIWQNTSWQCPKSGVGCLHLAHPGCRQLGGRSNWPWLVGVTHHWLGTLPTFHL